MRRVEQLITQVRRATENTRTGTQDGISDEEFIQYLNDAQELCQSAIVKVHRHAFVKEKIFSAPGTETYTLPSDIWARHRIITLEYSPTGNAQDYYRLEPGHLVERLTVAGAPSFYCLRAGTLLLNAYPSSGSFRLIYEPLLRRLDKRRATRSSSSETTTQLTALTLSTSSPFVQADFDLYDTMTAVTALGVNLMSGIQYTAVSAGGVVTLLGGAFTFASGEGLASTSYFCLGTNSTTHSDLPDQCEKFLLAYCQRRILDRDSSEDRKTMREDELQMLDDIIETFSDVSGDIETAPVLDNGFFDDPDLW